MNSRGWLIGVLVSTALLTGCAATHGPGASSTTNPGAGSDSPTPTPSSTTTLAPSDTTVKVDPAGYPLPPEQLSEGLKGVLFTAGGGALQCGIFDPLNPIEPIAKPPEFGCEVSVDGFPYPPLTQGPMDSANAFVSLAHQAPIPTSVTDATYGSGAPALAAGTSITWSTVTCTALAADEVRCVDATSGHGMRVSVRDYDLF